LKDTEISRRIEGAIKWLGRVYYNRANNNGRWGPDYADMIVDYETAVRIDPGHAAALKDLAWLRVVCPVVELRDAAKAVAEATKACELTDWKNHDYLSTLAGAYAEVGDFDSAVKWQQGAIRLLSEDERFAWQANYQVRLKLYESGKPHNQKGELVGWWKFDEGSGIKASDSSANGYDGTLNNMDDSSWVEGVTGSGLQFDGVNDYVLVPALSLYTDTVTMSAWIKRDGIQPGADTGIVYRGGGLGLGLGHGEGWTINHHLGYNWNDRAAWDWDCGLFIPDGQWAFVALVVEPKQATLYLGGNGTLSSATNVLDHCMGQFDGATRIGHNVYYATRYFKGCIDDVRIYSYALSQEEIAEIYDGKEPASAED
jgi:hypothetical protein